MCLFFAGGAGSPSSTMWPVAGAESYRHAKFHLDPYNRLATIQYTDATDRQDRQRSDSIGRTVLQTLPNNDYILPFRIYYHFFSIHNCL